MIRKFLFLLVILLSASGIANATTRTTASCSQANFDSTVSASSDGDTVVIKAGSCTWSSTSTVPAAKGLTITGEGYTVDSDGRTNSCVTTIINGTGSGGYPLYMLFNPTTVARVYGLCFDQNNNTSTASAVIMEGSGSTTLQNFRFDHNMITNTVSRGLDIQPGWSGSPNNYVLFGNVDHNTFTCPVPPGAGGCQSVRIIGPISHSVMANPTHLGDAHNVYVESNTFTYDSRNDGCVEGYNGGRFVFRYNIIHTCLEGSHGADSTSGRGVQEWEVYRNAFDQTTCISACGFGQFHFRSGIGITFDNTWTGDYSNALNFDNYRSDSGNAISVGLALDWCSGSHAWDGNDETSGPPGRHCIDQVGTLYTDTPDGTHSHYPVYIINNTRGGATSFAGIGNSTNAELSIVAGVDLINQAGSGNPDGCTSAFDGTCGVGRGLHADRPATCTGPDAHGAGGVGYWETDTGGNWDLTNGTSNDGKMVRCTATNTWTDFYTPYTFPYPGTADVTCTPDHLGFVSQPSNHNTNTTIGTVTVWVYDSGSVHCDTDSSTSITIAKGGTLGTLSSSSSLTQTVSGGAASWTDLSIGSVGTGSITAAASGLTGASSTSITITNSRIIPGFRRF